MGALRDGKVLKGLWFDRSAEYEAKRRGERFAHDEYATEEVVELSPLPCKEHLSRRLFLDLLDELGLGSRP